MNKIVLSCVAIFFVGCTQPNPSTKTIKKIEPNKSPEIKKSTLISTTKEPDEFPIVTNPEFNCLFTKKTEEEKVKCLQKPFGIKIIGYYALLETKGKNKKEQIIYLNGEKYLYILVNTWNVALPIKTSIEKNKILPKGDNRVIQINIDEIIDNKIEIFDGNGEKIKVIKIIR